MSSINENFIGNMQKALSSIGKADALLVEVLGIQDSLKDRLESLKIDPHPAVSNNEILNQQPDAYSVSKLVAEEEVNNDPLLQLEHQVIKTRQLWTEMDAIVRQYDEENALLDDEEAVDTVFGNFLSTISWAKCLDDQEMNKLKESAQDFLQNIPDDDNGRLHRLAEILIFAGKQLTRSLDFIEINYLKEYRLSRRLAPHSDPNKGALPVGFKPTSQPSQDLEHGKDHSQEADRLKTSFERLNQISDEVSKISRSIANRWPGIIMPSDEEVEFRNLINLVSRTIQAENEKSLLDAEEVVNRLYKRAVSAIEKSQSLVSDMNMLKKEGEKFEQDIPDDETNRLHRLVKILIFLNTELTHSLDVTKIAYSRSSELVLKRWSFHRSQYVEECNRLSADYDSLTQLSNEVTNTWREIKNKWPLLDKSTTEKKDGDVEILSQSVTDSLETGYDHYNKAVALANKGSYKEALVEYDKAIKLTPHHPDFHNNKGLALLNMKRYLRAIWEFDKAIKLNPSNPDFHNNKGVALNNKGSYKEALVEYDKAIKLNPNNQTYYNNMNIAFNNKKRQEEEAAERKRAAKRKTAI